MYSCSPKYIEKFCLRLLLFHVKGPQSFEYLKTVNNVVCSSFEEACILLNLYKTDDTWLAYFDEAILCLSPSLLRHTFCTVCVFNNISNGQEILDRYFTHFTDDFAEEEEFTKKVKFLKILKDELKTYNYSLKDLKIQEDCN